MLSLSGILSSLKATAMALLHPGRRYPRGLPAGSTVHYLSRSPEKFENHRYRWLAISADETALWLCEGCRRRRLAIASAESRSEAKGRSRVYTLEGEDTDTQLHVVHVDGKDIIMLGSASGRAEAQPYEWIAYVRRTAVCG